VNRYGCARVALAILAASLVQGCETRQGEEKSRGGDLKIGIFFAPSEINPITTDSTISADLLDLVFNTLVRLSGDGTVNPELAERWETSSDGTTWTFHLRKGVLFHDGTPLTAEDVKATYDSIRRIERSGYHYSFKSVKSIEVLDPFALKVTLDRADNFFLGNLGEIGIAPKALVEKNDDFKAFNQHPVGSGPYRFVSQDDQEIVLEANDHYFAGRPHLDRIIVKVLPNETANINHLIAGNIDMAFLLNPEDYGALSQIGSIHVYDNWYPLLYMLFLNDRNALFADPRVRQALNFAVDKEKLIARVLKGKGEAAGGTVDRGQPSYNASVGPYAYRPAEALRLLKESGWEDRNHDFVLEDKDGRKFEFTALAIDGEELTSKALRIIQQGLSEVGIRMAIRSLPFDQYLRLMVRERNFEANLFSLVVRSLYDSNFTFWHSSQIQEGMNFSAYQNPTVDRLLEASRFDADPVRRKAAFQDFQKAIHDDPPGIFLFWREMPIAVQARFRGFPERRMESLRDLVNVYSTTYF
jgi:peptide/nickel transport system substrate-binding protein